MVAPSLHIDSGIGAAMFLAARVIERDAITLNESFVVQCTQRINQTYGVENPH